MNWVVVLPLASYAQTAYTDKAAFLAALPPGSLVVSNDWESDTPGALVPSGTTICQGVLSYSILADNGDPLELQLLDFFETTTPANYLGPESDEPRYALFLSGDSVTLTFDTPVTALGVHFVACPGVLEGVFHITAMTGGVAFTADSGPWTTSLADGSEPYFVGIIAAPGDDISAAAIFSDEDLYSYSLDEIIFQCTIPAFIPGDANLDGLVGVEDIPAFVAAMLSPYSDPCDLGTVDLNGDGSVDGKDIQSFVNLLT